MIPFSFGCFYENFYELVKENNIEVEDNYSDCVPYIVRSSLYDSHLKNTENSLAEKENKKNKLNIKYPIYSSIKTEIMFVAKDFSK